MPSKPRDPFKTTGSSTMGRGRDQQQGRIGMTAKLTRQTVGWTIGATLVAALLLALVASTATSRTVSSGPVAGGQAHVIQQNPDADAYAMASAAVAQAPAAGVISAERQKFLTANELPEESGLALDRSGAALQQLIATEERDSGPFVTQGTSFEPPCPQFHRGCNR